MSNKLGDLNDHLFSQLKRLSDGDLKEEDIDIEIKRAQAIVAVSDQVVNNAKLQLGAAKLFAEHGAHVVEHLPMIGKSE